MREANPTELFHYAPLCLHTLPAFRGQTHVIFVQSYGDIEKSDVTSTQKNNQKGLYKDDGRW
jgi:hypothetical protein